MFFRKTLDMITLFHRPGSTASARVANLLKQASTRATQAANEAPDAPSIPVRDPFELTIIEQAPTEGQVETILEYAGHKNIPHVIEGASNLQEALRRFQLNKDTFKRPLVVDWNNGKVVIGDNESEILKLLAASKN